MNTCTGVQCLQKPQALALPGAEVTGIVYHLTLVLSIKLRSFSRALSLLTSPTPIYKECQ